MYDAARLHALERSQLALSGSPDVAGSRSWGNWIPRIVLRAVFLDLVTGARFVALNTHLDPLSARSRVRAGEQIRAWAAREILPVVVTGDLNSRPGSTPVAALLRGDALRDAWDVASARLTPEWGTYARYRTPRMDGARIDAIVVSPGVRVNGIGILALALPGLLVPRFMGVRPSFDILYGTTLLIAAWSNVLDLYTSLGCWDLPMHFLGTGMITAMLYLLLAGWDALRGPGGAGFAPRQSFVIAPMLALALSALWEIVEWLGYTFISDEIFVAYTDIIGDIVAGGLGGLVAGLVVAYVRLERTQT